MKTSKFLTILETLDTKEIHKFKTHLHANHKNLKVALSIFKFYAKFFLNKKPLPSPEKANQKLFEFVPKEKTEWVKLNNGLSDLNLILKDYLIQMKLKENEFEKEMLWLQVLEERGLTRQRELQFNRVLKSQQQEQGAWNTLQELKLYHHEFFRNNFEKENPKINWIEKGLLALDDFYFSLQLKYNVELLNRKSLLSISKKPSPLLKPILQQIKKGGDNISLTNQLYFKQYQFFEKNNTPNFNQLYEFLSLHKDQLDREDKLTTLLYLLNFMAGELRKKNYEVREVTFKLYQFGLDEDQLFIHNGIMDHGIFRNIVNLACHLKKYSWAEKFILNYQDYLEASSRQENISIAWAMIHFEKQQFKKVIQNITNTQFSSIYFILATRVYLMASNFELGQIDSLNNDCESFIRYFKRSNKLGKDLTEAAVQFGKIFYQILQKKSSKTTIQQQIKNADQIYFKAWLERKLKDYQPI